MRPSGSGVRRVEHAILAPAVAFGVARIVLWFAAASQHVELLDLDKWVRWDAEHYLSIAAGGYELVPCSSESGSQSDQGCGNAGWMPLYPILVALFSRLGLQHVTAASLVSALCALATLVMLWNVFLADVPQPRRWLVLMLAAFFPGQIFHHAAFPLSLFAFLILLSLSLLVRGHWTRGAFTLLFVPAAYSPGLLAAATAALWGLSDGRHSWRQRLLHASSYAAAGALGFALVCLGFELSTGAWDAFFKVQAKYGHDFKNPLSSLRDAAHNAWLCLSAHDLSRMPSLQTVFVTGMLLMFTTAAFIERRRLARADVCLLLFLLPFWLYPLSVSELASARAEATLLPVVVLGRRLPTAALAVLVLAAVPVAYYIGQLFFSGKLV
jgi:hypothetical protein